MVAKKYNLLFFILVILVVTSCSTKKNTFTRRVYHNLTGHYNAFWNGREELRQAEDELREIAPDNYNKVLPVYNYGTEAEAQSLAPYLDKAIEKASINIQRHSMYFNRREYCNWIDDSYMLIGKSYFYKQEYNSARRTFRFIANQYDYNDIKYSAMLWLADSYAQMGKYKKAQSTLDQTRNMFDKKPKEVPKKDKRKLPLLYANTLILQEKYSAAKPYLLDALELKQKKRIKNRARFILGQIYQRENELYRASQYYTRVIKKNPPYEMAFNARINLARSYDSRYSDSKLIVKELEKMLGEDKNIEFQDQIYYALAEVAFKDDQDSLGIEYLKKSVATSVQNDFQKSASALKLADIYFTLPEYELAQAYYDTAMQVLPEDYPNYEQIKAKAATLTELVQNLMELQLQDSLQMLASLPEDQRDSIIDKVIEKVIEEEKKRQEEEMARQMNVNLPGQNDGGMASGGRTGGKWYFYNPSAMSFGFSDFKNKWGSRKLEDNWRLSNKQMIAMDFGDDRMPADSLALDSLAGDSTMVVVTDPKKKEYYLQNIPLTEDQLKQSNQKVLDALYNLGFIYKDKLDQNLKAVESFEELLERFPDNQHKLQTYYQLYRLYQELGDQVKVDCYAKKIVDDFPESDYAKLIQDPDYYKQIEAEKNVAVNFYKDTWQAYQNQQYLTVINNSNRAIKTYEEPKEIIPKFEYLKALSIGKIEVIDSLIIALQRVIDKYPDSEVKPLAQNVIDHLKDAEEVDPEDIQKEIEEEKELSIYNFKPDETHLFVIIVPANVVNTDALKVRISDFNSKFHSLKDLSIKSIILDDREMITVGNFDDADKSMKYYNSINDNEYVQGSIPKGLFAAFTISLNNYPVFYKDKDEVKYLKFFEKNYLKEDE